MLNASQFDQNLILTGYIGPTQLQVSRRTADLLKLRFVDFERRLEEFAEMPAQEIRAIYGEARLKTLEDGILSEISLYRGALIAISGETLLRGALATLKATGPVICAVASVDAVLQRLHLAMGARFHDPRERDNAIGQMRRAWTIRGQDDVIEVDTSTLDDARAAETIAARWRALVAGAEWRG
jgi:shikimate kinase